MRKRIRNSSKRALPTKNWAHHDSNVEQKFRKLPFYPVKLWALLKKDSLNLIAGCKYGKTDENVAILIIENWGGRLDFL